MREPSEHPGRETVVLVVEDDDDVRTILTELLLDEGFKTHEAADAQTAIATLDQVRPDIVLLDVSLPTMNGLDMLAEVRRRGDLPVILVSGRGTETDRVVGLRLGADDYVVKPFSPPELVARIHTVLRRSRRGTAAPEQIDLGRLRIELTPREVFLDGAAVELTAKEFDLLAFLAGSPKRVFTRGQLLNEVWESSTQWQDPATVTEHIRRIRRKIEDDPDQPRWVVTVRGVGYRFES